MAGSLPRVQLWHMSRGIVFSEAKEVVYPTLPLAAFHSSAATAEHNEGDAPPCNPLGSSDAERGPSESPAVNAPEPSGSDVQRGSGRGTVSSEAAGEDFDGPPNAGEGRPVHPPVTSLDFKIPEEIFQEARRAEPGTPESFWSYSLYRGPGEGGALDAKVKVHYCKSKHTTERVLQNYFMDEKIIGFDLEWWPNATRHQGARYNTSLIQIASQSRIALFHLALYPKNDSLVAPSLKKILEDPGVTKVGVCIKGDCTRVRNFLQVNPRGIFELSHLYKLVKHSSTGNFHHVNRRVVSLATQTNEYLRLPLFKGSDVRSSDWSQQLQMSQIIYSASDAYAALQLYYTLNHLRENLDPVPPLPRHAELNLPIRLADGADIPTSDDGLDLPDGEDDGKVGPVLSPRYLRSLGDSINIEPDGEDSEPILQQTPKRRSSPTKSAPKDPITIDSEAWAVQYRLSRANAARATMPSLRAYRIWHCNVQLDPEAIAKLLRDPPLQTATVVNYILEAIRLEKLPYDAARLQAEVLKLLPADVMARRYKPIFKACQEATQASA